MPPAFKIHFLGCAELAAASGLLARAFNLDAAKTRRDLALMFHGEVYARCALFAAVAEGQLAGIVACHATAKDERLGSYTISKLAVDPAKQRAGIGRALMDHAEHYISAACLRGKAGRVFVCDSTKKGKPGSRYYESRGYQPTPYAEDGAPRLVKFLPPAVSSA